MRAQGEMGRERASGRLAMTEDESGSTVPMFIKSVFTCYSSHISSGVPNESDGGGYGSLRYPPRQIYCIFDNTKIRDIFTLISPNLPHIVIVI